LTRQDKTDPVVLGETNNLFSLASKRNNRSMIIRSILYMYYSTKEMKKKLKACLPGYENFPMLRETNNQFSMA
jgi:hypothetical protein